MNYSKTLARRSIRFALLLVFFLHILLVPAFSQTDAPPAKSKEMRALERIYKWRAISLKLTNDIVDDTKSDYLERPLVLAKLAEIWWEKDNYSSQTWLKNAVNEITFERMTETRVERTKRLEIAARLIKVVMPKDKKLAGQLIEYVIENAKSSSFNPIIADELVKAAIEIAKDDTETAKNLGTISLKFGRSYELYSLIGELNLKNESLAERLLREVLVAAFVNQNSDITVGLMSSLSNLALRDYKEKSISERARKEYLNNLYNFAFGRGLESRNCQYLLIAANLISFYKDYSPEQAFKIRRISKFCKSVGDSNGAMAKSNFKEDDDKPETIEEFLNAAKETNDELLKAFYYKTALEKLYYSKRFEEILNVLGEMEKADRTAFGEDNWESWWTDVAVQACIAFIDAESISDAYQIIGKTPKKLRPAVRSALAYEFKESDRAFAIQMLNDARKGLEDFEIKPFRKANLLIYLTNLSAEIIPSETINVFRDAVKAVNLADSESTENAPVKDFAPLQDSISLPIYLLENEELNTLEILSQIKSRKNRIRFRLGFLEQSLRELDKARI